MSRAYRIKVKESLTRGIHAEDEITVHLEILEVLPPESMAQLLEAELKNRGFEKEGDKLVRQEKDGVKVVIDPCDGSVTVKAEQQEEVELSATGERTAYDDVGPSSKAVKEQLKKDLQAELEKRAEQQGDRLQKAATEKLEGKLCDLQGELNQVVNRVTAEALKQKAASMGQIKEISEDPQTGSLSITVEV